MLTVGGECWLLDVGFGCGRSVLAVGVECWLWEVSFCCGRLVFAVGGECGDEGEDVCGR